MNITIFGGTKPQPGDPEYQDAANLGRELATRGHTVITGGYMGTMEAVSKGANEAGGHVIGVTCEEIERWRHSSANPWVKEEWKQGTLQERMIKLIDASDAVIILPGGVGTLAEISLMWNRMVVEATPRRKMILIGAGWQSAFEALFQAMNGYFPVVYQNMLEFQPTVMDAVDALETAAD
jgi:uncharacterized protein (TIGR00725 family)